MLNRTGLTEHYQFTLKWAAENLALSLRTVPGADLAEDPIPAIFAALQQQLGLKLERSMSLTEILVIDHVEKTPTEN